MAARGHVNGMGPVLKKMLWKMGTCSRLSERFIGDGRDSAARRVVSDTDTPKSSPEKNVEKGTVPNSTSADVATQGLQDILLHLQHLLLSVAALAGLVELVILGLAHLDVLERRLSYAVYWAAHGDAQTYGQRAVYE